MMNRNLPMWMLVAFLPKTEEKRFYCPICETPVKRHDRYCSYCGQRITYHKEEWEDKHE